MSRKGVKGGGKKDRPSAQKESGGIDWSGELKDIPIWPVGTAVNLCILVAFIAVLFREALIRPTNLLWGSDFVRMHSANKFIQWESFNLWGRPALWDPTSLGGRSFVGDPIAGILNPLGAFFWVWETLSAYNVYLFLLVIISAFGMYFWARKVGCSSIGASVASLGFCLSGKTAGHIFAGHLELVSTILLLPWVLLALEHLIERCSFRNLTIFAMTLFLFAVQGSVQMAYLGVLLMVIYACSQSFYRCRDDGYWRGFIPLRHLLAGILFFALVSAAWWFPIVRQTLLLGARSRDVSFEFATFLSAEPNDLGRLFLPFAGLDYLPVPFASDAVLNFFWETASYPSITVIALGVFTLIVGWRDRKVVFVGCLVLFSLKLALGKYSPVYWIAYEIVPGFSLFRAPGRFFFFTNLGFSLLAGWAVSRELEQKQRFLLGWGFIGAGFLLLLVILVGIKDPASAIYGVWAPCLACILLGVVTLAYGAVDELRKVWHYAVFAAIALELLIAWTPHINSVPMKAAFPESATAEFLVSQQEVRECRILDAIQAIPQEVAARYGLEIISGYNPGIYGHYLDLYKSIWSEDASDITELVAHPPEAAKCETILDLLNVRFVVTGHEVRKEGYVEVHRSEIGEEKSKVYVFERATSLPRVYLTGGIQSASSGDDVLAALCTLDPKVNCVMEGEEVTSGGASYKEIEFVRESEEQIRMKFSSDAPGVVVVSQTWHPDWTATVDGVPTEIMRVNHAQIGVRVGEGDHEVVLWYRPWDLYAGLMISAITLMVLGVLSVVEFRRRKFAVPFATN